jgi:phospholipase C
VNNGLMDGFLRSGGNDAFAISYYTKPDLPFLGHAARAFTTYDRFFCSLLAPTYPNRQYMHAAQSYGNMENRPPPPNGYPDSTIFGACARRGISSRCFYVDTPVAALWGETGIARSGRVEEYYERCRAGKLPHVSFVDPSFANEKGGTSTDEHPFGDIRAGQAFMSDVVHAFMESPQWKRGALFIVYDEWGGFFDHVPPPRVPDARASRNPGVDFGQMGIRIPAVAISPYARRGHVSHDVYGFESILKLIEYRFGLPPLTKRDAYAQNIGRSFDWQGKPRKPPGLPDPPAVAASRCAGAPASTTPDATARPKEHDLTDLHTSGYLERLGFKYRPATPATTFRRPHKIVSALEGGS